MIFYHKSKGMSIVFLSFFIFIRGSEKKEDLPGEKHRRRYLSKGDLCIMIFLFKPYPCLVILVFYELPTRYFDFLSVDILKSIE